MMTCQTLAGLLLEWISGELEAAHAAAIQEHLNGCSSCVAFVHSYRITVTLSRQLPPLPMRTEFARQLQELLKVAHATARNPGGRSDET